MFGTEPSFNPTCLLCLHYLDSLSSFFVLFLFFVFLLVWCFLMGSGKCLSTLVVILALSFLDCSVLMLLFYFMSWLLVCLWVFLGCLFRGGGRMGVWPTGRCQ